MVGRTESRTQADDRRFELIVEIGCIACNIDGVPEVPCQVQHLLEGYRLGHQDSLGLCPWHHVGECEGSIERMTKAHGPSLRHNSKAFRSRYGSDEELLMIQDAAIRIIESARRRNEYLPPDEIARLVHLLHREVVQHRSPNPNAIYG